MGTININLSDSTELNLPIGRQMENDVTAVAFDFSDWVATYGSGTLSLSVQRKGDAMPYPVTLTVSGNVATWEISETDTARKGTGKAQLTYTVGDHVKKSVIYKFTVYESLGVDGEYPAPGSTWMEEMEERIEALEDGSTGGLTDDVKAALLQIAEKVAYIDDQGQTYYDALYDALYPPVELSSISAVYTQSGTVYPSTSLDSLKSDLVVTAHYTDSTSEAVTTYTLSGTLSVGTSTVTVSYGGKTTTFNVTVSAAPTVSSISATYTQSGTVYDTDSLDSLKTDLVVTATWSDSTTSTVASTDYTLSGTLTEGTSTVTVSYGGKTTTFSVTVTHNVLPLYDWDFTESLVDSVGNVTAVLTGCTRDSSGVNFTAANQAIMLGSEKIDIADKTYILDIPSMTLTDGGSNHARLLCSDTTDADTGTGAGGFVYRHNNGWTVYTGAAWGTSFNKTTYPIDFFNNKRLKIYIGTDLKLKVSYAEIGSDTFTEIGTISSALQSTYQNGYLVVGGTGNNNFSPVTVSRIKIWEGEV